MRMTGPARRDVLTVGQEIMTLDMFKIWTQSLRHDEIIVDTYFVRTLLTHHEDRWTPRIRRISMWYSRDCLQRGKECPYSLVVAPGIDVDHLRVADHQAIAVAETNFRVLASDVLQMF